MKIFLFIAAAVCTYLIAGINPAIVLSKLIYHEDIRTRGSHNPGFTNFKRCYGNKWAWWVFLLDLGKGAALTALFAWILSKYGVDYSFGAAYTGVFALLGHAYPIWYRFQGGKGFLVYLSVIFVIDVRAGLIAFGIMVVLLLTTKYMSLSTIAGLCSCPITLCVTGASMEVTCICLACVLYIAFRHRENFKRLLSGNERKFTFRSS